MSRKAQGSELFFIDPEGGDLVKVGCVTTIDGIDSTIEQIETTCLEADARTYESGLATPGAATFTINTDPKDPSHVRLHELKRAGATLKWALGWRQVDANGLPVLPGAQPDVITDSSGDYEFDLPEIRTWLLFDGYQSAFPFSFTQNSVVTSNVSIQISGDPIWIPESTS